MLLKQVVVTNQITRFIYDDPDWLEGENETMVTTALGNTWSHCVNTRLLLSYSGRNRNVSYSICKTFKMLLLLDM